MKSYKEIINNLIIIFTLFLSVSCTRQQSPPNQTESFLSTLDIHLEAIVEGNLELLDPTVSDHVIMIGPDGTKYDGKEAFMQLHKNWFALNHWKWNGEILKTEYTDSLGFGLIKYHYVENDSVGNNVLESNAYLILIFKQVQAGWQLIHDQNTLVP